MVLTLSLLKPSKAPVGGFRKDFFSLESPPDPFDFAVCVEVVLGVVPRLTLLLRAALLGFSPLFVGMVLYSLNLFHFPLCKLAGAAWFLFFAAKPDSFLIPPLAFFLMMPLTWVFYLLIELPAHRFALKLGTPIQARD
jgi:hypothetical protein